MRSPDNHGSTEVPLNLLAFDTSTENLTVAVAHATQPVVQAQAPGAAQASATLIPLVYELLERAGLQLGQLDAIVFGRGPGSFTGLRTACAVAQGMGFGGGVPLLPVDTLLAVAEQARHQAGAGRVVAILDARMDEVYTGRYEFTDGVWTTHEPPRLMKPADVELPEGWVLAGNALATRAGHIAAEPTAAALLRLAPALLRAGHAVAAADALPLYIRDKVAQTTQEREAAREARAALKTSP